MNEGHIKPFPTEKKTTPEYINTVPEEVKKIVEALLFAVHEPISIRKISEIIEGSDVKDIKEIIHTLREEYDTHNRAFQIEEIANGFQLLSRPE